jgi:hypothetical protein
MNSIVKNSWRDMKSPLGSPICHICTHKNQTHIHYIAQKRATVKIDDTGDEIKAFCDIHTALSRWDIITASQHRHNGIFFYNKGKGLFASSGHEFMYAARFFSGRDGVSIQVSDKTGG